MKYNVAIIGGGPAGYTAAEKAAAQGLSVVLFEKKCFRRRMSQRRMCAHEDTSLLGQSI